MARFPYIIPSVTSLPAGYEGTVFTCRRQLTDRLGKFPATVIRRAHAFCDGQEIFSFEDEITIGNNAITCDGIQPIRISRTNEMRPAYIEVDYVAPNNDPIFTDNTVLSEYVVFAAPGKKSFFSDSAYKYASPPIIDQIASFGVFCEGYPVVMLKRGSYSEALVVINPYLRPLTFQVHASNGRSLPKARLNACTAEYVDLSELLHDDEQSWNGRIQLESKARVIVFDVKHKWGDRTNISDHEHLDPFRADPTHLPVTRTARSMIGKFLQMRGIRILA